MTKNPVLAVAHRGEPLGHRENTLASFAAARTAGADMIELDLQATSDGQIVVLHDPTLERLWGLDRLVSDLELSAVQAVRHRDLSIPTLAQVLDEVPVPLMIDFTGPSVVHGAVLAVREAAAMASCLFVSGHLDALADLRGTASEARIGVTWTRPDPPPIALLSELRAEFWNPVFPLATAERVADMHGAGYRVSVWTVDEPDEMVRLLDMGVDAVISNRIGVLRRLLDRRRTAPEGKV